MNLTNSRVLGFIGLPTFLNIVVKMAIDQFHFLDGSVIVGKHKYWMMMSIEF